MGLSFKNYTLLSADEVRKIRHLRNQPHVRKQMKTSSFIPYKQHKEWIQSLENSKKSIYFAIFEKGEMVGSIDATSMQEDSCSWGVFFKKDINPLSVTCSVSIFISWLFEKQNMQKIYSQVKPTNKNALMLNKTLGFLPILQKDDYVELELKKALWQNAQIHKLKRKIPPFEFIN